MPKIVDECVKKVKDKSIESKWKICWSQYKKTQKKKREEAKINNKLQNKLNKMFKKLDN